MTKRSSGRPALYLALVLLAGVARAEVAITVNTFDDVVNAGDGLTSLREAISAANGGTDDYRIYLPRSALWSYSLIGYGDNANAIGDIDIIAPGRQVAIVATGDTSGPVTPATRILGGNLDRVFHVHGTTRVVLDGLIISAGMAIDDGVFAGILAVGGGILAGAGAQVTLIDTAVNGCSARGGMAAGGGFYLSAGATLTVEGGGFAANSAIGGDGADGTLGGAGSSGSAAMGGALFIAGLATINNCGFSANVARGGNGGDGDNARNSESPGGAGGAGGTAMGGVAVVANDAILSGAIISFSANRTEGGNGGDGGNGAMNMLGTASSDGGDGGAGGNVMDSVKGVAGQWPARMAFDCAGGSHSYLCGTGGVGGTTIQGVQWPGSDGATGADGTYTDLNLKILDTRVYRSDDEHGAFRGFLGGVPLQLCDADTNLLCAAASRSTGDFANLQWCHNFPAVVVHAGPLPAGYRIGGPPASSFGPPSSCTSILTTSGILDCPLYDGPIYVSAAGNNQYPYCSWATASRTITNALAVAPAGAVLLLDAAVHPLPHEIVLTDPVTLRGDGDDPAKVIVRQTSPGARCFTLAHAGARLEGLTITGGSGAGAGGGVSVESGSIEHCIVRGNQANSGGGVYVGAGAVVSNVIIRDNSAALDGGGVLCAPGAVLRNCLILGNTASRYGGGVVMDHATLESSTLCGNTAGTSGGAVHGSWASTVRNSILWGNSAPSQPECDAFGDLTADHCCSVPLLGAGSTTNPPLFADVNTGDYRLRPGSPCLDTAASQPWMTGAGDIRGLPRITGPAPDMGAYELGAFTIAASANNTNGTITPSGNVVCSEMDDAVFVLAPVTADWVLRDVFVDGQSIGATNVFAFPGIASNHTIEALFASVIYVATNGTAVYPYADWATAARTPEQAAQAAVSQASLILIGDGTFTVTNTIALTNDVAVRGFHGAEATVLAGEGIVRMLYLDHPRATVEGVTLTGCLYTTTSDGAVYLNGKGLVQDCVIRDNGFTGVRFEQGGHVRRCRIVNNYAGAVLSFGGLLETSVIEGSDGGDVAAVGIVNDGLVAGCTIISNAMCGAFTLTGGRFTRCLIAYNSHTNPLAGGVFIYGGGSIDNCIVRNNSCPGTGGIIILSAGTIDHCTVVGNTSDRENGIYLLGGILRNTISYGNFGGSPDSSDIRIDGAVCSHCCAPSYRGENCVTSAPAFVAEAEGDYRLTADSPCIDAGLTRGDLPSGDFLGIPRPQDGDGDGLPLADIGAFEYFGQATATVTLAELSQVYDGIAKRATATTAPPGLAVTFTYDGSVIAPIHVGSYTVVGAVSDVLLDGVMYRGSATGTLVVSKGDQRIVFPPIAPQKTGASVGLAAADGGSGNPVVFAVASGPGVIADGTNLTFTGVGNVDVVASQAGNDDYNAAAVTNLVRVFSIAPDRGPFAGGNTIAIASGDFGTITNVLVGGAAAGFVQGGGGLTVTLPAATSPGVVDIVIQTAGGDIVLAAAYAYNPEGVIWDAGMVCGWEEVASLPIAVNCLQAGVLHGALYAVGGGTASIDWGPGATNVFRFDGTNWTAAPGLPSAFQHFASAVYGDALYALGGCASSNAYRFDGTNWTQVASLPMILRDGAAAVWGGGLYHIGGYTDMMIIDLINGTSTAPLGPKTNVYCYNGATWTEVRGLPAERHQLSAAVLDGKLYAIGGAGSTSVYRYDGTNWTEVAGLPELMEYARAGVLNGVLYLWGGGQGEAGKSAMYQFDGLYWKAAAALPHELLGVGGCVFDGALYSVAGRGPVPGGTGPITNVYRSTPCTDGVEPMSGAWVGGGVVVIRGIHLGDGGDITSVTLCGAGVASIVSQSATQVVVVAGNAIAAGIGDVRVFSTSFGETVKSNAFAYAKRDQSIAFAPRPVHWVGGRVGLAATAGSGFLVSFTVASGPGLLADGTNLSFTGTGVVSIVASQAGDENWNAAPDVVRTIRVRRVLDLKTDFDGSGNDDIAVFDPASGNWAITFVGIGATSIAWGAAGDLPVPADYTGGGRWHVAVFRPANGTWYIRGVGTIQWGVLGDVPVPADYNGDGAAEIGVYRPSTGTWHIRGAGAVAWGAPDDVPVPDDYDGDGTVEIAVYRPSTGTWHIRGVGSIRWGADSDVPVPADLDGDGVAEIAVYRPSTGTWHIRGLGAVQWGAPGDVPVPADFDGDGTAEIAVYRSSTGMWYVRGYGRIQWGSSEMVPLPCYDPSEIYP